MNNFKNLVLVIGLIAVGLFNSPAQALTSSYNKESQILVIDGVNLDQDFTVTESDLSELLTDRANSISPEGSAFKIRFFFSPSVTTQIINQIESNQDDDGISPSLEILKNNDLRTTRTRVKVARVESKKKSFAFLNYINPDSVVKLAISTEYTFDLHDFSDVEEDETVGFEFEISTAKTFSGNIDFKVSLNSIETGGDTGGSSVDNGSGGGSSGGGTGGGTTDVENVAINNDIDDAVSDIATKLGDSYDAVNKTVVCGSTSSATEVDVCDADSLDDFNDSLQDAKSDLKSLETDNIELKQIINTARKDKLLTKKEANKMKNTLDSNNKKIKAAKKEVNTILKKIAKNNGKGITGAKAQRKLQAQLDTAKTKLEKAHTNLKNDVLRPLLDKNIISQEVFDKYNVDIDAAGSGGDSSGGLDNGGGTVTTTVSTKFPDGSEVVVNDDGSTTTTFPDGTVVTDTVNADGSISRTTTNPDGTVTTSKVVTNDDGSTTETITNPDGSISIARSVTNDDGSVTVTTTNPDGTTSSKTVVKKADGSIVTNFDDGSQEIKKPDGSVSTSVVNADGSITTTTKNADGTTTIERATLNDDGSISIEVTNPDGTTTLKREVLNDDGSVTTTITNPDGTITTETAVLNDDGSITTTITNPDGTTTVEKEVLNADGSVTTTTTNADGTTSVSTRSPDGSVSVTNADGSITITKPDGTEITKTPNANGSFTVVTKNPDGTTTTSTEVINADGSVTTTTVNPDGSTTVETAVTNADGSITTTSVTTTPNVDNGGGDGGDTVNVQVAAELAEVIENYSLKVAESFSSIDRNYVCGATSSENSVDICDIEGIIAFQSNIIESNAQLRGIIVNDSINLLQAVNGARRARLISKKKAKRLRFRIKRNNKRIKNARKTLVKLDNRIKARVARGRPFDSIKANKFFLDTISKAQFRINRSYVKLQETVVRPLFNQNLVSDEIRARFDVSISELN